MNLTAEDLHHRRDQLRFLATLTDDPLAEQLCGTWSSNLKIGWRLTQAR